MTVNTRKMYECPRCAHKSVKVNDAGAWCIAFPCRWHARWHIVRAALRVMKDAGVTQ